MKFTDGYWAVRPEYTPLYAVEVDDVRIDTAAGTMTVYLPTARVRSRGDTLNRPMLTITLLRAGCRASSRARIDHHAGRREPGPAFALNRADGFVPEVELTADEGVLRSGDLEVRVPRRRRLARRLRRPAAAR